MKTLGIAVLILVVAGVLVAVGASFGRQWSDTPEIKEFLKGIFTGFWAGFGLMSAVIITNWLVGRADRIIGGGTRTAGKPN